jgi:phosphoribosylformylglycinamidine synthase subunit PurL
VIILVGTVPTRRSDRRAENQLLGGSRYLKVCHGLKIGPPPHVDLAHEIKVQNAVRNLIREGLVKSAHDCSEGGLGVAVAECCFHPEKLLGAELNLNAGGTSAATVLFNESQSRIVISVAPNDLEKTMSILRESTVPFEQLGEVSTEELCFRINKETFRWQITDLYDDWWNAIRRAVEEEESIPSL